MQSLFKEFENLFSNPEEIPAEKENKKSPYAYSPFALQDALGEKNIKNIWIEYHRLIFQGVAVEDLIFKIVGKVREMVAINAGASKEALGTKDYPYNKSKRDLKNWRTENLQSFYTKLISIYHQSRMAGGEGLEIALEKTLLSI